MPNVTTDQLLDTLRACRFLDDAQVDELRARPEAQWGDVASLSDYARERGWLTAYQAQELSQGRGDALALGGYCIFDKVSDGPAGVTFRALHPALQQPVIIRLVRPEWLAPADTPADYLARTHAATQVHSPHVTTVLDAGTHGDRPYVVQEAVDGCSLFHLVNEMGAMPVGRACEYARQAALAVQAAHDKGVVHGDVSPHTLLITPVQRAGGPNGDGAVHPLPGATIKLTELGVNPVRPAIGELTYGQSDRLGPVAFSPPERLTSGNRTPAGDRYGLGATLYFLLTARPPYAGDSPLDVMLHLQQAEPTPIESLRSDLDPTVVDLVHRLLSRDPAGRPSADEVVETLLPFCDPAAMPTAPSILVASETFTQPGVPTAVPLARNLDQPPVPEVEPFADAIDDPSAHVLTGALDQPLVEPLSDRHLAPEVHPLDEYAAPDDHLGTFGHSSIGADTPRTPRPRVQATGKNKAMIVAGLLLHLTGTLMCLGWLGIIPNPFAAKSTQDNPPIKKEKDKEPNKAKNRRGQ